MIRWHYILLTISWLAFLPLATSAQVWKVGRTLPIAQGIMSFDLADGKAYLGTQTGSIIVLDREGREAYHFSAPAQSPVTSLAAWNRFKIFAFYAQSQQFVLLDRFGSTPTTYDLRDYDQGTYALATMSTDGALWLYDATSKQLGKYDLRSRQMIIKTQLSIATEDALDMGSFQNLLILGDKQHGIYIFDQFGKLIKQIQRPLEAFKIISGDLLYRSGQSLYVLNLHTYEETHHTWPKSMQGTWPYGTNARVLIDPNQVTLYHLE